MDYNIEFQIASLIFIAILIVVFYSKKRWPSTANKVFRVVLWMIFSTLVLDVASVITITKVVAGQTEYTLINDILSKGYLIAMVLYIATVCVYSIVNTITENASQTRLTVKFIEALIMFLCAVCACIIILAYPLLYSGQGKWIYSYGVPSNVVYVFSSVSVVAALALFIGSWKKVPVKRLVPMISFVLMEGSIALIQMVNKELLIIGLGTAATGYIMYFALENPDMNMINELNKANDKANSLLLNILPKSIADRLENSKDSFFEEYENVSILFMDLVDFSHLSVEVGATRIVVLLNEFFGELDSLIEGFKVEKIKTMGDCYMVCAGCPDRYEKNCEELIKLGRQIFRVLHEFNEKNGVDLHIRIGINNGPVVAGVIGRKKFAFDLWGDTVNLAFRLQTCGRPDCINISERVKYILGNEYSYAEISEEEIKGFGKIKRYIVL